MLHLKRCLGPELWSYTYHPIVLIGELRPILGIQPTVHRIFIDCLSTEATVGKQTEGPWWDDADCHGDERGRGTDMGSWDGAGGGQNLSEE